MPRITNPNGTAINIRVFITLSFFRLLIAFGYWKREEGSKTGYVRCQTGAEVHATVECVARPFTSCAPLQLSKMQITFGINLTTPGEDCCLIVNSFEKNYRDKKT